MFGAFDDARCARIGKSHGAAGPDCRRKIDMQRRFLSWAARMGLLLCGVLLSGAAFHARAQALRIGGTGSALGTVRLLAGALAKQNPTQPGLTVVPNLG